MAKVLAIASLYDESGCVLTGSAVELDVFQRRTAAAEWVLECIAPPFQMYRTRTQDVVVVYTWDQPDLGKSEIRASYRSWARRQRQAYRELRGITR